MFYLDNYNHLGYITQMNLYQLLLGHFAFNLRHFARVDDSHIRRDAVITKLAFLNRIFTLPPKKHGPHRHGLTFVTFRTQICHFLECLMSTYSALNSVRLYKQLVVPAALLALSACASGPSYNGPQIPLKANPSAVIAAELGFNRLAQEKGQWTAFRETMARDAEMFEPARVRAVEFLKGKADPAKSVTWQPYQVWASCDGSAGVTHGAWQAGSKLNGYFTTVWLRQADGSFKWILDHGVPTEKPSAVPESIIAKTAQCKGTPSVPIAAPPVGADMKLGVSRDQTLQWISTVNADRSRTIMIRSWDGTAFVDVLADIVAAPKQ